MLSRKNKKELDQILKNEKKLKYKSGCKKRMPTTITILILFAIFFGFQAYALYGSINLKVDDLIYSININEKLEQPLKDADLASAKTKLNIVGLTTLANQYIISNLENNQQTPTQNLDLTQSEFASLLVPIYYAKFGKSTTIYELIVSKSTSEETTQELQQKQQIEKLNALNLNYNQYSTNQNTNGENKENNDNIYTIKITSSFIVNIKIYNIKINDPLYVTEIYEYNQTQNTLVLKNYEMLNVNTNYIKKADIDKSKTEENFIQSFLSYTFLNNETNKNYIQQLNYSNFSMDETTKTITLS